MASTPPVARQCPDTVPMEHKTPTKRHRSTGLAEAHDCSSGHRTPQPPESRSPVEVLPLEGGAGAGEDQNPHDAHELVVQREVEP